MASHKKASPPKVTKASPVKPVSVTNWRRMDIVVTVVAVALMGYGVWNNFIAKSAGDSTLCREPAVTETVKLDNDGFSPSMVQLNRCDRLKVINNDDLEYEMALGTRDKHTMYPGFTMQSVRSGEYFEFYALKAGTFVMHDHLRDNARLQLEISE